MTVVAVVPSRGRPYRAWEAVEALRSRSRIVGTTVVLVVDADDPELETYRSLRWPGEYRAEVYLEVLEPTVSGNLVRATNTSALRIVGDDPEAIVGNLGDDHVARTDGWDRLVRDALERPGIAYGDDLLQHEKLPTAPFVSGRIVEALGWYFLPTLEHMYVDNVLRTIGERAGVLRYLPELVIEHVHPGAGKAETDAGYLRADASTARDRAEYHRWRETSMRADVRAVRRVS